MLIKPQDLARDKRSFGGFMAEAAAALPVTPKLDVFRQRGFFVNEKNFMNFRARNCTMSLPHSRDSGAKVFWFFFSKKNILLSPSPSCKNSADGIEQ